MTGPKLNLADYGGYLFLLTAVLALFLLRVSAVMAIAAGLLSLPLYLYAIAPEFFGGVSPVTTKSPLCRHSYGALLQLPVFALLHWRF